jgi:hypothetical protein
MDADEDRFRQIKLLLGTLDDLNQERRRLFTDWATRRLEGTDFVARMRGNLSVTRDAAARFETLLG